MKNIKKLIIPLLFLGSFSFFSACNSSQYTEMKENKAFIPNSEITKTESLLLDASVETLIVPINLTQKADRDIVVKLEISEQELNEYNKKYNSNYVLYPESHWNFAEQEVLVKAGQSTGFTTIFVQPFTSDLLQSGNNFALPVTLSIHSDLEPMEGSKTKLYTFKSVPYANTLRVNNQKKLDLDIPKGGVYPSWTIEYLVYLDDFKKSHNQVLFELRSRESGASEQTIFTRFENGGFEGLPTTDLECKQAKGYLNARPDKSNGTFQLNRWYHIAMVQTETQLTTYIDGKVAASREYPAAEYPAKGDYISFGAGNLSDLKLSELRFWKVARTAKEVNENMYGINPKSSGLVGYWKLNEGEGTVLNDATGNSPAGKVSGGEWFLNQKIQIQENK